MRNVSHTNDILVGDTILKPGERIQVAPKTLFNNIVNLNLSGDYFWLSDYDYDSFRPTYQGIANIYIDNLFERRLSSTFEKDLLKRIYTGISSLIDGGLMIIKVNNIFIPKNFYIIAILLKCFDDVDVGKTVIDPLAYSDYSYYLVCKRYQSKKEDKIKKVIKKCYKGEGSILLDKKRIKTLY